MSEKRESFEWYYDRFLRGVSNTRGINYENRQAVRKNNRGVDLYRDAAACIGKRYPEKIPDFALLLEHEQEDVRIACAVCLLSLMEADKAVSDKAVTIIRNLALCGSSFDKTVWSMWLKDHGLWES